MANAQGNPVLVYPLPWTYVVIGVSEAAIRTAIADILQSRPYDVEFSKSSARGKYVSLRITLIVRDEADRGNIFTSLNDHPSTAFVL